MKTIGFIDFYLDEWHANNYPAWLEKAAEKLGSDVKLSYAWAEKDSEGGLTTKQWCEKFGVTECGSIDELCQKSDFIIILAPSNPEKHLEYAEKALKFGKRTYIDKTFAPSYDEAKQIFDISERYNAQIFSSSALRYASELDKAKGSDTLFITGGGRSVEEYIIHQIEQLTVIFGVGARSVTAGAQDEAIVFNVEYDGGKKGSLTFDPSLPFSIAYDGEKSDRVAIKSDYFGGLITDIVAFFESGKCNPTKEETLEIMKIRDAVLKADKMQGKTVLL